MKKLSIIISLLLLAAALAACGKQQPEEPSAPETMTSVVPAESGNAPGTYQQISQDEAKRIMAEEKDVIILDVRTEEEYEAGHIPGAVCVPNETIGTEDIPELPDKNQTILVYCRTGRRSKEASEKLASIGYTNVLEFGGIVDWTGEVIYPEVTADMRLFIEGQQIPVVWERNQSVDALKQLASGEGLTVQMSKYGGFEQVGTLGSDLVRDDVQMTTEPGDIVLYSGNQIVVFYGTNSWAYTKLGKINLSAEQLTELLGEGDVELRLQY